MAKVSDLIDQVLYEKKQQKSTFIFYNMDVFIQEFKEEPAEEPQPEPEVQPEQPEGITGEEPQQEESTKEKRLIVSVLNEEIFKFKSEGVISVPIKEAKSIITLEDVLAYMNRVDTEKNDIINDLVIETILNLINPETQQNAQEILNEGDKLNVMIDYGFDKEDSIGIQISKNPGSQVATLLLRKDGKPMNGPFDVTIFNNTIANIFLKEL